MTVTMRGRVKGVGCGVAGVCAFVELKDESGEIINSKSSAYFFISVKPLSERLAFRRQVHIRFARVAFGCQMFSSLR